MQPASPIPEQTRSSTLWVILILVGLVAFMLAGGMMWDAAPAPHSSAESSTKEETSEASLAAAEEALVRLAREEMQEKVEKLTIREILAAEAKKRAQATLPRPTPIPMTAEGGLGIPVPVANLLNQARAARDKGDMGSALIYLREAQVIDPRSPHIISELALTYEKMSLTEKATEQWQRIYAMGESAGIYFTAAEAKTKALALPKPPPEDLEERTLDGRVRPSLLLGEVATTNDTGNTQELRNLTLRVPVHALPHQKIEVNEVFLEVAFYEQFNDGSVVTTSADVNYQWSNRRDADGEELPVDWTGAEPEVLEVTYAQAPFDPEELRSGKLGKRKYYGYLVRLYYKGELNASISDPVKLSQQFPSPQTLQPSESP